MELTAAPCGSGVMPVLQWLQAHKSRRNATQAGSDDGALGQRQAQRPLRLLGRLIAEEDYARAAQERGEIADFAVNLEHFLVEFGNELRHRHALRRGDPVQDLPEAGLEAHRGAM